MLNSKQRSYLKGLAANIDPTFQIGKSGVIDTQVAQIDDYLRVHELIKIKILENSLYTATEAANEIADKINADVVICIGSKAVLYKPNPEKPIIQLPKK